MHHKQQERGRRERAGVESPLGLQGSIRGRYPVAQGELELMEGIQILQKDGRNIRNICILAHVDHGKAISSTDACTQEEKLLHGMTSDAIVYNGKASLAPYHLANLDGPPGWKSFYNMTSEASCMQFSMWGPCKLAS